MIITVFSESISFIKELYTKRFLIKELTKRDFKQRFVGSTLGLFWAFLEPMALTLIFWFVWGSGLRGGTGVNGVPFVVYLLPAMFSWQFFSEALGGGTDVIRSYSFLVKKVDFKLGILPIVKILSSLILHIIFMLIVAAILIIYGYYPNLYWLQVFYYIFATCILLLGLTWVTSSVNVFAADVKHIISIFIRFGFFLTPIIWQIDRIPAKYHVFIKLNPAYYIVQGYRNSLILKVPFWELTFETIYFWSVTLIFLILGMVVFKKLRPHFADVL